MCQKLVSIDELADAAFAMREIYNYLDDLRKEVKANKELCERMTCLLWARTSTGDPVRTPFVTATPCIKMTASIPKRSTNLEAWEALMRFLKIPEELWSEEVVRPHWPSFVEYTSKLLEQGKPLPDGIDPNKTYPVYSLTLRGKIDVDHGYESGRDAPKIIAQEAPAVSQDREADMIKSLGFETREELIRYMNR